jgi:thiamine-phosphate pyrophosphorylase
MAGRLRIRGLYAVTPDWMDTARLVAATRSAIGGGAGIIQYRNKRAPRTLRLEQATRLAALCREAGAIFIVNDDIELAVESGADGLHLGRGDGSIADARLRLGADRLLGASCYDSLDTARAAVAAGADHVAFGSFFPSAVKPEAVRASIDIVARARSQVGVPVVGIGGITAENAGPLVAAGIDAVAVISAVFHAQDVAAAARAIAGLFCRPIPGSE